MDNHRIVSSLGLWWISYCKYSYLCLVVYSVHTSVIYPGELLCHWTDSDSFPNGSIGLASQQWCMRAPVSPYPHQYNCQYFHFTISGGQNDLSINHRSSDHLLASSFNKLPTWKLSNIQKSWKNCTVSTRSHTITWFNHLINILQESFYHTSNHTINYLLFKNYHTSLWRWKFTYPSHSSILSVLYVQWLKEILRVVQH